MHNSLPIKNGIVIPGHELEITASRSGGPGGQYVNKTSSRITVRWNVKYTSALNDEQKLLVLKNLEARLTTDGDFLIHNSQTRSQLQNKELALNHLAQEIRKALYVPKVRMKTRISKGSKEAAFREKKHRADIKKMCGKKFGTD